MTRKTLALTAMLLVAVPGTAFAFGGGGGGGGDSGSGLSPYAALSGNDRSAGVNNGNYRDPALDPYIRAYDPEAAVRYAVPPAGAAAPPDAALLRPSLLSHPQAPAASGRHGGGRRGDVRGRSPTGLVVLASGGRCRALPGTPSGRGQGALPDRNGVRERRGRPPDHALRGPRRLP